MKTELNDSDLPGLYQSANSSSMKEQKKYFNAIACYLLLLISASLLAYHTDGYNDTIFKILSTLLFLTTLAITIWLKFSKPDNIWYNGRAVAESVKTRSWRWMMKAEPYLIDNDEQVRKHFINDLKIILQTNESIISKLGAEASAEEPISEKMLAIRNLNLLERTEFYRKERILNQQLWYKKKSKFNKRKANIWFGLTIFLHISAIILLLINIGQPTYKLPIGVIAVAASSVLSWVKAKKHNELSSSYTLTSHEISLLRSETIQIQNDAELSEFIINCESAFSREHTQWFARKNE